MAEAYGERKVNRLDICFVGSLMIVSLVLAVNIVARSIHLIYMAILFVLGGLGYATVRCEKERGSLRDLWILALLSVVFYPLVDYFFEAQLGLVAYLTDDPKIVATPVYIPLYWVLGVLLFGYAYYRVCGLTGKVWIGALSTGLFSAASATFVENLFNGMEFYRNTPSHTMIGYIPVYVTLGYILTFSFMPLYLHYKYVCGFLLYGFVGTSWYLFSLIVA